MPFLPPVASDAFDTLGRAGGAGLDLLGAAADGLNKLAGGVADGFAANVAPSVSGFGTRQSRVPNNRAAMARRHLMRWLVPEQPIVQMYVNPQNFKVDYKKHLSKVRTKGGYTIQYWGEELTSLNLSGTTGTSGIEGINVLYDIYRNEQLMFDPFALFLQAERDRLEEDDIFNDLTGIGDTILGEVGNILTSAKEGGVPNTSRTKPTLASLAFTVELYWSGEVYRGFFENFSITERADNIGLFDYSMTFTVTQRRGFRQNFFGWHRSATSGPSNSNPVVGVPHSFGARASNVISASGRAMQNPGIAYASFPAGSFASRGGFAGASGDGFIDAFDTF
jgi:hypothetical protein